MVSWFLAIMFLPYVASPSEVAGGAGIITHFFRCHVGVELDSGKHASYK